MYKDTGVALGYSSVYSKVDVLNTKILYNSWSGRSRGETSKTEVAKNCHYQIELLQKKNIAVDVEAKIASDFGF